MPISLNKRTLLFIGIGVVFVFFIFIFAPQKPSAQKTLVAPAPTAVANTANTYNFYIPTPTDYQPVPPEEITTKFYAWWLTTQSKNITNAYKTSPYLTDDFKNTIESFDPTNSIHDPVFCQRNKKTNFLVTPAYVGPNGKTYTNIQQNIPNGKNLYRVVFFYNGQQWLIDDIVCVP
jgi:hypothetical protein